MVCGWQAAAEGPFFGSVRILSLHDGSDAVAVAAVWSAGTRRPGLIEPMDMHQDHRGRGYGTMMTRTAAAALHEMGSSSAAVCRAPTSARCPPTWRPDALRISKSPTDVEPNGGVSPLEGLGGPRQGARPGS